jgi:hypothetical protein
MPIGALAVFGGIASAAGLIAALKYIFEDHNELNQQLDDILRDLQNLRSQLIQAINDVLEAIDGIRIQIDEDVANDAMALADRALYSDRAVFDDAQAAMGDSFQAADRLAYEQDVVFAGPFMYVANIRLAIMKDFTPTYFCRKQFRL